MLNSKDLKYLVKLQQH